MWIGPAAFGPITVFTTTTTNFESYAVHLTCNRICVSRTQLLGGGHADASIDRSLSSARLSITFATTCKKSDNAFDLESIGVTVVEIELNHSSFDVFIKGLNPAIVLFDRFMTEEQFGWRVSEQCPDALRILDTEDLHFLRKGRQKAFNSNQKMDATFLTNDTAKREIASIYRSDLSLVISETEMEILTDTFKIDPAILCYLPFMISSENCDPRTDCKPYSERRDFVSIGNFLHPPNLDVVRYLKKDIWPRIRKELPETKLHIYGAYDTPNIKEMHNEKEGFLVHGFVENAFEVLNSARVLLAPLRFGAGLKGNSFRPCKRERLVPCRLWRRRACLAA